MSRLLSILASGLLLALAALPGTADADGAWLDAPIKNWNTPGMAIPRAPTIESVGLACPDGRPPESAPERAVVAAGWKLYGRFARGTPVEYAAGLAGHDGMCRPMGFQYFFFVDGVFVGTLSPEPMDSRFDGSLLNLEIVDATSVTAIYARYSSDDPLCCPSRRSTAWFKIEQAGAGSFLSLFATTTEQTRPDLSDLPAPPGPGVGPIPPIRTPGLPPAPTPTPTRGTAPVQAPIQLPR